MGALYIALSALNESSMGALYMVFSALNFFNSIPGAVGNTDYNIGIEDFYLKNKMV